MISQVIGLLIIGFVVWLIYKLAIESRDYDGPKKKANRFKPYEYKPKPRKRNKHGK